MKQGFKLSGMLDNIIHLIGVWEEAIEERNKCDVKYRAVCLPNQYKPDSQAKNAIEQTRLFDHRKTSIQKVERVRADLLKQIQEANHNVIVLASGQNLPKWSDELPVLLEKLERLRGCVISTTRPLYLYKSRLEKLESDRESLKLWRNSIKAYEHMRANKLKKTSWRVVQQLISKIYESNEVWPGYDELVRRLNCSRATIRKAIKPSLGSLSRLKEDEREEVVTIGKKLSGWMASYARHRKSIPTTSLNEILLNNIPQTRELDPSAAVTLDDPEDVLALLIQDAEPKVRAKLNAIKPEEIHNMTGDQVREMVEVIVNDPYPGDRVLGRKV